MSEGHGYCLIKGSMKDREVTMSGELSAVRIIIPGRNVAFYTVNQCSDSDHVIGKRYFKKKIAPQQYAFI